MTPQLAAGLTAFVGICLIAGWVTGFRNRSYVGLLGLAFVVLAGFPIALAKAGEAHDLGLSGSGLRLTAWVLLLVSVGAFLLAAIAAVRETARRLREVRESHEEAAQGLLELVRASREREEETQPEGGGAAGSDNDTA